MATESQHPAEQRLRALARTRRDASEALPAWSPANRQRLRDEVARLHQRGNALPDPAAQVARSWAGWRWLWAWGGVGVAGALLVWVVMFSQPQEPEALALKTPGPTPESDVAVNAPSPAAASWAMPSEAVSPGPAADLSRERGAVFSSASDQPRAVPASERRERFDFNAARRVRHAFRSTSGTSAPPILKAFEIFQTGGGLEIVDQDGSTFTGRLPRRAPSESQQPAWTFEAQGFSRSLGKGVRLTGNFGEAFVRSGGESTAAVAETVGGSARTNTAASEETDYWQESIAASVLVEGGLVFEVHAEPVSDEAAEAPAAPAVKID